MAANRNVTFGVCSWVLDRKGVTAVARARQLGFEAIEIDVFSLESYNKMCDPAVQAAYVKAAATHGIKLVSLCLGIFSRVVAVHDEAQEELVWEILRHMIDVAVAMKMEYIYCVMARGFGINNADEMAQSSAMLRRGCEYIGDRPLQLATESELSITGNRELIEQVNHPNIRILLDTYNGISSGGYNAAEMVHELKDVLCNVVHAKDHLRRQSAAVLLGQGDGDFRATVQALREIGFEGYVMNENSYSKEIEARTAADLTMLKRIFA